MGALIQPRAALAAAQAALAATGPRREQPVDLANALFERDDLAGLLVHDVLAKLILPIHLEHQPAEVADALLSVTQE
ncbi:MAG TPA: hypothetical protein VF232_04765 [Gaiellaceae bacterium]